MAERKAVRRVENDRKGMTSGVCTVKQCVIESRGVDLVAVNAVEPQLSSFHGAG